MANQNTTGGLIPIRRQDSAKWGDSARVYFVPASATNALYVGDPIVKIANSTSVTGVKGVDLAAFGNVSGTTGDPITGAIVGFQGVTAAGSAEAPTLRGLPTGPIFRPATTSLDFYVFVQDDNEVQFSIQMDSTNVLPVSAVGKTADLVYAAGNAINGSGVTLANASITESGITQQVTIQGFDPAVNNNIAQAYARVLVTLNSSTEGNGQPGI